MHAYYEGDTFALRVFAMEQRAQRKPIYTGFDFGSDERVVGLDPALGAGYSWYNEYIKSIEKLINKLYTGTWDPINTGLDADYIERLEKHASYEKFKDMHMGSWNTVEFFVGEKSDRAQGQGPSRYSKTGRWPKGASNGGKLIDHLNQSTGGYFDPEQIKNDLVKAWKGPLKQKSGKEHKSSTTDYPYGPGAPGAATHKCPKGSIPCEICAGRKINHAF